MAECPDCGHLVANPEWHRANACAARPRRKIRLVFAWYDFWIGAYWDRRARRLYILPLPCIGLSIDFGGGPRD